MEAGAVAIFFILYLSCSLLHRYTNSKGKIYKMKKINKLNLCLFGYRTAFCSIFSSNILLSYQLFFLSLEFELGENSRDAKKSKKNICLSGYETADTFL